MCLGHGNLSQGDVPSGGMQCTFLVMTYLCRASTNNMQIAADTISRDIDSIIQEGSDAYWLYITQKYNGVSRYLMCSEFPENLNINGNNYVVTQLEAFCGILGTLLPEEGVSVTLSEALSSAFQKTKSGFLTIGDKTPAYTIGIFQIKVPVC